MYNPEANRRYKARFPDRWRRQQKNSKLKKNFGLTLVQYEQMFIEQGGNCAICGKPQAGKMLAVDHDHETGEVRGLLCSKCNVGLGWFSEDLKTLKNAIAYLKKTRKQ